MKCILSINLDCCTSDNRNSNSLFTLNYTSFPIYASISNNIPITVKNTQQKTNGYIELNPLIGNNIGI